MLFTSSDGFSDYMCHSNKDVCDASEGQPETEQTCFWVCRECDGDSLKDKAEQMVLDYIIGGRAKCGSINESMNQLIDKYQTIRSNKVSYGNK